MAVDPAWAEEVARGERPATLRFWRWASPAVICGRYQSIADEVDLARARELGIHVVRRASGGGAMLVTPGGTLTYSLYAPAWFVDGLSVARAFRLCDAWLLAALRSLGVDARFAGLNDIASPAGKIGGAAQLHVAAADGGPGCVLHHDTLAYAMDGDVLAQVLRPSAEKMSDKAVKSAARRVDPLDRQLALPLDALIEYLADFARRFPAYNG